GAEVAVQEITNVDQVLLNERFIQVVMNREVFQDHRRQWPFAIEGAAGGEAQNEKASCDGDPQDGDRRQQSTERIFDHGRGAALPGVTGKSLSSLFLDGQPARAVDVLNIIDE